MEQNSVMYWILNIPSVFISSDQTNPLQVDPLKYDRFVHNTYVV